jgi:hypothetical protein
MSRIFRITVLCLSLALMSSTALACLRCEGWWGEAVCAPGHETGGTNCFVQSTPDFEETCFTYGRCENGTPPWGGIDPYGATDDDGADEKAGCKGGQRKPKVVSLSSLSVAESAPEEVRQVLSALQPSPGLIYTPNHFEGVTEVNLDHYVLRASPTTERVRFINFEGSFVKDARNTLAQISFSGDTEVSEVLIELSPQSESLRDSKQDVAANDRWTESSYSGEVFVIH